MPADFDVLAYRANFIRSVPLVVAVPATLGLAIVLVGFPFDAPAVIAGAVGWIVALALRAPLAVIVMRALRQDRIRGDPIVAAVSGPAEELVRLLVLLVVVGRAFSSALWFGLGWGAIEAVWAVASGAAILALIGRDPEAEQARALLASEETNAPLWGVLERIWATLLHIGYTLLIAASPILVIFTVVAHSTTNLLLLRFGPVVGVRRLQAIGFVWTAAVLLEAWLAWTLLGR